MRLVGSREDVWDKKAVKTPGGLRRTDLMINPKTGKIISKKASEAAKKRYKDSLKKGVGFCRPCIQKYLKGEMKINKNFLNKKTTKKAVKPKTSPKRVKVVGPKNEKRLKEIEKDLEKLERQLNRASNVSEGKFTKKVTDLLDKIKKTRKMRSEVRKKIIADKKAKKAAAAKKKK